MAVARYSDRICRKLKINSNHIKLALLQYYRFTKQAFVATEVACNGGIADVLVDTGKILTEVEITSSHTSEGSLTADFLKNRIIGTVLNSTKGYLEGQTTGTAVTLTVDELISDIFVEGFYAHHFIAVFRGAGLRPFHDNGRGHIPENKMGIPVTVIHLRRDQFRVNGQHTVG